MYQKLSPARLYEQPLISIIMAVHNSEKTVEKTIQSIILQTYKNIEYIVIDGASTDITIEIIRQYEDKITYWVSEPDSGIYDALNKGIKKATGDWLYFIGADDVLDNPTIIDSIFSSQPLDEFDILYGDVMIGSKRLAKGVFGEVLKLKNTIQHQGTFYNRRVFQDFLYQPTFLCSSDYELNLKLYLQRAKHLKLDKIIARCGNKGISNQGNIKNYLEENWARSHYLNPIESSFYNSLGILRFLFKSISIKMRKNKISRYAEL